MIICALKACGGQVRSCMNQNLLLFARFETGHKGREATQIYGIYRGRVIGRAATTELPLSPSLLHANMVIDNSFRELASIGRQYSLIRAFECYENPTTARWTAAEQEAAGAFPQC